jgi:hypothetical protein
MISNLPCPRCGSLRSGGRTFELSIKGGKCSECGFRLESSGDISFCPFIGYFEKFFKFLEKGNKLELKDPVNKSKIKLKSKLKFIKRKKN